MEHYYEIYLDAVPASQEQRLSEVCFAHGALGLMETMDFHQLRDDYAPTEIPKDKKSLTVYFAQQPPQAFIDCLTQDYQEVSWRWQAQPHKDWMEEWKKDFRAFPLAEDYWVVPSWLSAPPEAKKILHLDPGMAFGTGTHDTTQLASRMILQDLLARTSRIHTALDVGTGTGILAMLMARELGCETWCTEIDADARPVARDNFAKNALPQIVLPDVQIQALTQSFDLVVANIIDGILVRLREELYAKTKIGGFLLVTGILQEREADFLANFSSGLKLGLLRRLQQGEWVGFLWERQA